ncbi:hypothetical protein KAFR_0K02340 [Kazachstania africana CBS 2517]|uniref:tRNA pseudouridine synthase 1 n=1 Tax=Kazachstania africana (strain ATCC 22294 / BCRC 22015 / CBS 2517 / CECT 1963 / NBRC 1671 / NRRL Y-8276) TaxID=1071382 RepID=H2B1T9_KAZAF|nr:hypothetical protein KAFR_0K02340 [Kazachstania africana CBS 2517]CCF60589.1 hypothetical protein KAFR_0K02340 [Kazachstania africana CBS 2517]
MQMKGRSYRWYKNVVIQTRLLNVATNLSKVTRQPKHKVALMIGYCGDNYHGMQYNADVQTIEGALFRALCQAGAISKANSTNFNKNKFMRTTRTDKGVHAVCNLISLKMIIEDPDIKERVNSFLPADITLWNIQRVNKKFNCRTACESRLYEYALPTFVLQNPPSQSILSRMLQLFGHSPIVHQYSMQDSTLSSKKFCHFEKCLSMYTGTHNFHNFTSNKASCADNSYRYMKAIAVSQPYLKNNLEWISIKFHGQSFMLHQIRKMVALATIVTRYDYPCDTALKCFENKKTYIPNAPSMGLTLLSPMFSSYNRKLTSLGYNAITHELHQTKMKIFKNNFIDNRTHDHSKSLQEYSRFLTFLDSHSWLTEL